MPWRVLSRGMRGPNPSSKGPQWPPLGKARGVKGGSREPSQDAAAASSPRRQWRRGQMLGISGAELAAFLMGGASV